MGATVPAADEVVPTLSVDDLIGGGGATGQEPHASGALVWVGVGEAFGSGDVISGSACTATAQLYRPHINAKTGQIADCEGGFWLAWKKDHVQWRDYTVRDSFEQGVTIMQTDGTAEGVADTEENFVTGSPLGVWQYRIELTQVASSWVQAGGRLLIGADDIGSADNEGAEYLIAGLSGTAGAYGRFLKTGTSGGCMAASITVTNVSGTDQLYIGFRTNDEAFLDNAAMAYDHRGNVGLNANDGSIVSSQIAVDGEALDDDDSGVNWADGETRVLKYCISKAGVPTVFYTDAVTLNSVQEQYPTYKPVTLVVAESGTTFDAGISMVPVIFYLHTAEAAAAGIYFNWIELTKFP